MENYFEHNYFNTYYYSNIVANILTRDIELIGFISEFFSDANAAVYLSKPFERVSAFHIFIQHMVGNFFMDDMNEYDSAKFKDVESRKLIEIGTLYADIVFEIFGIDSSFNDFVDNKNIITYQDVEEYHEELTLIGQFEELFKKIAHEVFYILFNNRVILLDFNNLAASYVREVEKEEIDEEEYRMLFSKDGILKRKRIPEWVKRAVFFRDRGRCCFCRKDLSGKLSLNNNKHFDHIVPLQLGGLNDVSNLQLLCSVCNQQKSDGIIHTSEYYEPWY